MNQGDEAQVVSLCLRGEWIEIKQQEIILK